MRNKKRYCLVRDESCYWYLVPLELRPAFDALEEQAFASDDFAEFEERFGHMRIGMSQAEVSFADPRGPSGEPLT